MTEAKPGLFTFQRLAGIIILACCLTQSSCRSLQTSDISASQNPTGAERDATLAYWNSLQQINAQIEKRFKEMVASLDRQSESKVDFLTILGNISEQMSRLAADLKDEIGSLPVKDVDGQLISDTAQDLKTSIETCQHLSGMVEAANSYAEWSQRKKNPDNDEVFIDLLDSFIKGFEGRPFAGYDKIRKDEQNLEVEGQRISNVYLSHLQALSEISEQSKSDKIKEMELRAYLSKKYGVEFKPMQDSEK